MNDLQYMDGFGNYFSTESIKGALPQKGNTPQNPPMGLYAEQLSGSAFTATRSENLRTWFYRKLPSVGNSSFTAYSVNKYFLSAESDLPVSPPDQYRWAEMPSPSGKVNFIDSLKTMTVSGSSGQTGIAVHEYSFNSSMSEEGLSFSNADGDFLIVPQSGNLKIRTEYGVLEVSPTEICVIQRGMRFSVDTEDEFSKGYICENYGAPFILPDLGPIGANGLADPRDFLTPVASFEDSDKNWKLINKFSGSLWSAELLSTPYNVVAWHGNFVPYKYDLKKFLVINSVSFDHPDPSIFTVITSPSLHKGVANVDFVIFPPRWMVAEDTFRPPYYHRNIMSEFMGLIHGVYDAKPSGFVPGGASLHNCMTAHGPDASTFKSESTKELKPQYQGNTLAFMFESRHVFRPTEYALRSPELEKDYLNCWQGLTDNFKS